MKIAQVAPLYESVPPRLYGGTERVVSYLTEALVEQGNDVTLFASGDSRTNARLVPICGQALRLNRACVDPLAYHILMLEKVVARAPEFDIIHFHTDYLGFPLMRRLGTPCVTTLHGRLDLPDLLTVYGEFKDMPVVSISDAQRLPLAFADWQGTIYHGLPESAYPYSPQAQGYLAFLGRISPEKRADRAIAIAKECGIPLKIAAKVDKTDEEYFREKIAPLLDHPLVEFVGEIGDDRKAEFLGKALALLFPIDWPEPFGLVLIEAMACGTPVIAYNHGSVPEIIEDGVTGFLVSDINQAADAVRRIDSLSRARCRLAFETRFSARNMARGYVEIYARLAGVRRRAGFAAPSPLPVAA